MLRLDVSNDILVNGNVYFNITIWLFWLCYLPTLFQFSPTFHRAMESPTSSRLNSLMKKSYSLPAVARNPAAATAKLVKLRLREGTRTANTTRSGSDRFMAAYGHGAKKVPRPPVSLPALVSPRRQSEFGEFTPTDLTLTYLGVLERCEDYSRREIIKQDHKSHAHFQQWIDNLNDFNEAFGDCALEHNDDEHARRKKILSEERASFKDLKRKKALSEVACRKRERFIIPCAILEAGTTTSIDPRCCDNMLIELLWRGDIELNVALVFEGDPYVLSDSANPLKGRHESLAARCVGQSELGSGLVVGGAYQRFCLSLAGLARNIERVAVCVMGSVPLTSLNEGWMVIHSLDSQFNIDGRMPQHAAPIPIANEYSCTMCVLRRTGPSWRVLTVCGELLEGHHAMQLGFSRTAAFVEKEWMFMEASGRLLLTTSESQIRDSLECNIK